MGVTRLSFSLENSLVEKLDDLTARRGYENRSECLRDMIRASLVEREWSEEVEALGAVTLVFDHHQRNLSERLTELQHDHHEAILATTHVHLDRRLCAEMIMIRGLPSEIRAIADSLCSQKGVLHGALSMSSTGRGLT